MKNKEMLCIKQNGDCYIDKDCKWGSTLTVEEKAVRKDSDSNSGICDLLNQELEELISANVIEEDKKIKALAEDLYRCFDKRSNHMGTAKNLLKLNYQKVDEDMIVISKEDLAKQLDDKYYEGYHKGYKVGYYYGKQDAYSADRAEPIRSNCENMSTDVENV